MPALSAKRIRYETASRLATRRVYARGRRVRTVFPALDPHAAPCRVAPRLGAGGDVRRRRRDRGRARDLLRDPRVGGFGEMGLVARGALGDARQGRREPAYQSDMEAT